MNDYEKILKEAQENEDIVGFILVGSRGKGFENEHSDYDAVMIVKDEATTIRDKYEKTTPDNVDLSVRSLSDFKTFAGWESPESWDRYNYAHVKILVDKTGGELEKIVHEKGHIPQDKLDKFIDWWIDGYVNGVYRSVKCIRNGNLFGAHIEAANSMLDLLTLVFAMNGRHRPFLGYVEKELKAYPLERLPWSSDEFVVKMKKVLETADLKTQQELLSGIEKLSREMGHGKMFDGWEGKDKWTMNFK
jgi:predicted nucleotidyltransferase